MRLKRLNSWSYLKHAFFSVFHYPVKIGLYVCVYHGAIFWLFHFCWVPVSSVIRCSEVIFLVLFLRKESMILQLSHLTLRHGPLFPHLLHLLSLWIMMMASHTKVSYIVRCWFLYSSQCSRMASFACFADAFLPKSYFFSFSILKLNVIGTIGFSILSWSSVIGPQNHKYLLNIWLQHFICWHLYPMLNIGTECMSLLACATKLGVYFV